MKRLAVVLSLLVYAAWAAATPAVAPAASYDVLVCHDAPGNVNHAFVADNPDPAHLQTYDNCASDEPSTGGLVAADLLGTGTDAPKGAQARWRMAAPSGLKITRVRDWLYVRKATDDSWNVFWRTYEGTVFKSCTIAAGTGLCDSGASTFAPAGATPEDFPLDTAGIEFGVACEVASGVCSNGVTVNDALATLVGIRVTITDDDGPTITNVSRGLADGDTVSGSQSLSFDATDASGIKSVAVYVDGVQLQNQGRSCDYTYAKPCGDGPGSTFIVDTAALGDGPHTVQASAVDAAGNRTMSAPTSFVVNNAPPPPASGGGGGGGSGGGPAGGGGAQPPVELPPSSPPVMTPPPVVTPPAITPQPAVDDGKPPARQRARLRVRSIERHGARITVSGTTTRRASGAVRVSFQRRLGHRLYRARRKAKIRTGHWHVTLHLRNRLAHVARGRLRVRFAGNNDVHAATVSVLVPRHDWRRAGEVALHTSDRWLRTACR